MRKELTGDKSSRGGHDVRKQRRVLERFEKVGNQLSDRGAAELEVRFHLLVMKVDLDGALQNFNPAKRKIGGSFVNNNKQTTRQRT